MMAWDRPMLTDSGGFQVFSLKKLNKINDEGVEFASHIDGARYWITPEESMRIQRSIGAEIMMVFDECCPYPADEKTARSAMERSAAWARRCRNDHPEMRNGQALFGIVQGSMYLPLRLESIKRTEEIGFEGLAVGEIVYTYRQCFQKAGYDFDKSILHFAADYRNNPKSFNDPRRMISGMTIGLPVQAITAQAQEKQDDLRRYFPADEVAAIAQISQAASNLKKRWEEDTVAICDEWAMHDLKNAYTAAIASSLDDQNVQVTAELLTQYGYKPTDGVRLKIINGAIASLKMTTSHELGRTAFEIDALGNISQR